MGTKELKIQIPQGYEIDKEKSTFEKIVFKKISRPTSWDEYCYQQKENAKSGYYINSDSTIVKLPWSMCKTTNSWKNVLPSKELTEAFLAFMQLMSLRQAWIGDWSPNWNGRTCYYCIATINNKYSVNTYYDYYRALSFPTEEMTKDFVNTFKDLLEIARPLI